MGLRAERHQIPSSRVEKIGMVPITNILSLVLLDASEESFPLYFVHLDSTIQIFVLSYRPCNCSSPPVFTHLQKRA